MQAVYRILDANLDRAREGLRVIEEWCRFGLSDIRLSEQCKVLRQELAPWHTDTLRSYRDTPHDLGTALTTPQENIRRDVNQVLQANLARVQEALRVLEEYGKLYNLNFAQAMKQYRYRVYTLEQSLVPQDRRERLLKSRLYLVTSPGPQLLAIVEAALSAGLTLVQLREKETPVREILRLGHALRELCDRYGALFILNDRPDLALAVGADGVHLGQEDAPIAVARQILGPTALIGQSTHAPEQAQRAVMEGADYIGLGPVYATPTKLGRAAVGLEYVRYCAEHITLPGFAIGGIDTTNLAEVQAAGTKRFAVVRAIMDAPDPKAATLALLAP
ncbi:thiamine phosphate synthase [Candidatus Cyanaurora vandensis]|uniref:thiamine phosphate synthase n=1 Tax=Candidatus Cyanaurora vandensis TaxID=2714958 RepID=UPI00257C6291|nr:thiamine phosphate synthase [Candidatus Cyanaurora vandensis]